MTFLALLVIFCISRLLTLLTGAETTFHGDELNLGFVASQWMSHPGASPWNFQFDSYGGESLLLGGLSIPFVKIFGLTLLAVKIPSLLFSIALFIFLFEFTRRFFGFPKAVLTSLLLIFCPPAFVQFSLCGMIGRTEPLFFAIGMLYFFYAFLYSSEYRPFSIFLTGLFGGLGFWVYHQNIVIILTCLLSWIVLDRKTIRSILFLFFIAGLAAGLAPWLGYNFGHGGESMSFFLSSASPLLQIRWAWPIVLEKVFRVIVSGIPLSFVFFPAFGIHEHILSLFYFALACLPLIPFAFRRLWQTLKTGKDPHKLFPFLIFPFVFFAVLFASIFDINDRIGFAGYRYLSPLHLFLLPLPALLLPEGKIKKILLGALLFTGLIGQTGLFFQEPLARAQSYSGNSYYQMGGTLRFLLWPKVRTLADLERKTEPYKSEGRFFLLWGMSDAAMASGDPMLLANSSIHADEVLRTYPANLYLYEWKGTLLRDIQELRAAEEGLNAAQQALLQKGFLESREEFLLNEPGVDKSRRLTAAGKYFYDRWGQRRDSKTASLEIAAEIESLSLPPEDEAMIYRGMAVAHFRTSWDSNILIDRSFGHLLKNASPENRQGLFWGLGWTARAMHREDRPRALDRIARLPEEGKQVALQGLAAFEKEYGLP